jgi:hypothetical protein
LAGNLGFRARPLRRLTRGCRNGGGWDVARVSRRPDVLTRPSRLMTSHSSRITIFYRLVFARSLRAEVSSFSEFVLFLEGGACTSSMVCFGVASMAGRPEFLRIGAVSRFSQRHSLTAFHGVVYRIATSLRHVSHAGETALRRPKPKEKWGCLCRGPHRRVV